MTTPLEPSRVLDRGGKPTVRELLSSIAFNPADGTIRLNGDRVVMQRAAVAVELRQELTSMLGEEETRAFLLRLGFRSGQADARFVRTAWPHLDMADGFTAGTRLHTFSGVVRVETVHNAFDFRKKQFSAEFLWHDSIEAEQFRHGRLSKEPVCWTQLGYACGYASEFFDTLIVYKEVQCAGQGHSHCRVVGKPADQWEPNDPLVRLLRERVVSRTGEPIRNAPRPRSGLAGETGTQFDRLFLAPYAEKLLRAGRSSLPILICGEAGTGRMRVARHLQAQWNCSESTCHEVQGAHVDCDHLALLAKRPGAARRGAPALLIIDNAQDIASEMQAQLCRTLEGLSGAERSRMIFIATGSLEMAAGLDPQLWHLLAPLAIETVPLRERDDVADVATAILPSIAKGLGIRPPRLAEEAREEIEREAWPGNLAELRAVLTAASCEVPEGEAISVRHLAAARSRVSGSAARGADSDRGDLPTVIRAMIQNGEFALAEVEKASYAAAIEQAGGNLSAAARLLGLSRAQLAYRTKSA